jgi:ABC-type nitrate/sulfonate/bicarbonate transport system permease component
MSLVIGAGVRPRPRGDFGRAPVLAAQAGLVAVALVAWYLVAVSSIATPGTLPTPGAVAGELGTLAATGAYWQSVAYTAETWALGLLIASLIAIPLGYLLGANALAYQASRATVDFVRTLPPVALIPVVSLLYGVTLKSALVLVVFATVWPLLVQSMYGIRQLDTVVRDTVRTYHLGRWRTAWVVRLPGALPYIATGMRIASTMSLFLAVGVELIAGCPGLGASIAAAQSTYQTPEMYAYIVTAAILGVVLTTILVLAERRMLRWDPAYRKGA